MLLPHSSNSSGNSRRTPRSPPATLDLRLAYAFASNSAASAYLKTIGEIRGATDRLLEGQCTDNAAAVVVDADDDYLHISATTTTATVTTASMIDMSSTRSAFAVCRMGDSRSYYRRTSTITSACALDPAADLHSVAKEREGN